MAYVSVICFSHKMFIEQSEYNFDFSEDLPSDSTCDHHSNFSWVKLDNELYPHLQKKII